MFFKNVTERIKKLALILALVSFVACLFMVVLFVVATIRTNDADLRVAGIEGILLFAALAVILPMFSWLVYGFAELVKNSERQAESEREIKDLLRTALADGVLVDELARKLAAAMPKAVVAESSPAAQGPLAQVRVTAPAPKPAAPVVEQAPVATTAAAAVDAQTAPVQTAPAQAVPVEDATAQNAPAVQEDAVISAAEQIKPLRANKREF